MIPFINFDEDFLTTEDLLFLAGASGGAPMVEYTATGNPATFETNVIKPLEMQIPFAPVQDLHGYDSPWPAGGGKNKLDAESTFTSPTTSLVIKTLTLKPNTQYTASTTHPIGSGTTAATLIADMTETLATGSCGFWNGTSRTKTTDENGQLRIAYRLVDSETAETFLAYNYQLEEGSSATSFAPYSNVCPISGWESANVSRTGKNLYDEENYPLSGVSKYIDATDGKVKNNSGFLCVESFIPFAGLDGLEITLNKAPGGWSAGVAFYSDANDASFISGATNNDTQAGAPFTFIVPSGTKYIRFTTTTTATDIQLELGSTATTYEPYSGSNAEYEFPQEAGTVYGGTLTVNKDGTGTLVVDRVMWTKNTSTMNNGENVPGWRQAGIAELIGTGYNNMFDATMNIGTKYNANTKNDNDILFLDPLVYGKTQTEWQALAIDVQIVVAIATPVTYQLTNQQVIETLKGVNNVWADTNGVNTIKYMKKGD